ncbi:MAG: carboxypeptidase-like regulatory domain-containing protein [Acidobacteriia bacterium]|nr:carboxypeptidase-like regulatory domain-containing protein [Terriglobia bacterium]
MISRALPILLAAAATLAAQPATVEGRVTNTLDGKPVRKATVALRGTVRSGTPPDVDTYLTEAGADGRFKIENVPPGKYQALPSHPSFTDRLPDRAADPMIVTLEPGQHAVVSLQLIPDGVISGRTVDQEGDPIRAAYVEVLRYSYVSGKRQLSVVRSAPTNDRGEYRAYGIPPGSYYLRAAVRPGPGTMLAFNMPNERIRGAPPELGFATTFYPGARDVAQTAPLELKPGAELTNVDIRLQREAVYSVRVKLPESSPGTPFSGMTLQRRSPEAAPSRGGWVQRMYNGFFEFAGVPPGPYVLTATHGGTETKGQVQYARHFVEIVDHDVEVPTLDFVPGIDVPGAVKVEGTLPSPLTNLRVLLQSQEPGPGGGNATVDADGAFAIHNVLPETYQLHVMPVPRGAYLKSVKLGDRVLPNLEVDLTGGARAITLVLATDGGRIEGQVLNAEGEPAPSVRVTLIPDGARADRRKIATSDDKGDYVFQDVAPGDYRLFAWLDADPGAPQDPEFRKPFEKLSIAVTIEPSSRQTVPLTAITVHNFGDRLRNP